MVGASQEKKIGCVIYHSGKIYQRLAQNTINSLKVFHPEVDIIEVTDRDLSKYAFFSRFPDKEILAAGIIKYFIAFEEMALGGYDKILCLGADTIVTGQMDTLLYNENPDILVTLDYPAIPMMPMMSNKNSLKKNMVANVNVPSMWREPHTENIHLGFGDITREWLTSTDYDKYEELYAKNSLNRDVLYCNADVVCFNSAIALKKIINNYFEHFQACKTDHGRIIIARNLKCLPHPSDVSQEEHDKLTKIILDTFPNKKECDKYLSDNDLDFFPMYHFLGEQAALNRLVSDSIFAHASGDDTDEECSVELVDSPILGDFSYNVRSLGILPNQTIMKERYKYLPYFHIKNNKLFNHAEKEIKVWHYCAGLSSIKTDSDKEERLKGINNRFSDEVRRYFVEQLNCGEFFD
jgi:lipopolysaccharide biosynthesis glycosyltransferase